VHDHFATHNVAELREVAGGSGYRLQRVPQSVLAELNETARRRMLMPEGSEVRFVTEDPDETVRVTLSSETGEGVLVPFWGPFQSPRQYPIGEDPTTVELAFPDRIARLDPGIGDDLFVSPHVWRLAFHSPSTPMRSDRIVLHGVEGASIRPPTPAELPDEYFVAYGTSITEGVGASGPHLAYPWQIGHRLGMDCVNLGTGSAAHCEPAMARFVADHGDWSFAILALSVNMLSFGLDEYRDRIERTIRIVSAGNPSRPVFCVTLFPFFGDLCDISWEEWAADPEAYRRELRDAVAAVRTTTEDVHLVEGPELLDPAGLSSDLLHPGDLGMGRIAESLAERIREER
jgi:lysophospholipase L1-like esterase